MRRARKKRLPRIGFSTGKHSPVSALIRWFTKANVSHAYVIFYDPTLDDEYILEADTRGFQPMRYSQFKKNNNVVMELDPHVEMGAAIRMADRWVGEQSYDYEGFFSMVIVIAARWFKKKIKNPFHSPHSMYCSEAMTKLLQFANFPGAEQLDPPSEDPMSLATDMLRNGASNVLLSPFPT
jgi:hypothetical protein